MNINIELPAELHKRLRVEAASRGVFLQGLVVEILSKSVKIVAPAKRIGA